MKHLKFFSPKEILLDSSISECYVLDHMILLYGYNFKMRFVLLNLHFGVWLIFWIWEGGQQSCIQNFIQLISTLGPTLFNTFLNNLFVCLQNSHLNDFVDDTTITATCENINDLPSLELISTLEKDAEQATGWFNNIHITNQDKFEDIVCSKADDSVSQKLIKYI